MGEMFLIKDKKPVAIDDESEWALEMCRIKKGDNEKWIVGKTEIGEFEVSTVFLFVDYNHFGIGTPLLFETMVFSRFNRDEVSCERYSTWEEAEAGHKRAIEELKRDIKERTNQ